MNVAAMAGGGNHSSIAYFLVVESSQPEDYDMIKEHIHNRRFTFHYPDDEEPIGITWFTCGTRSASFNSSSKLDPRVVTQLTSMLLKSIRKYMKGTMSYFIMKTVGTGEIQPLIECDMLH